MSPTYAKRTKHEKPDGFGPCFCIGKTPKQFTFIEKTLVKRSFRFYNGRNLIMEGAS